jgi:3',5'-cyclic AMP phosphodiesterase CpdA
MAMQLAMPVHYEPVQNEGKSIIVSLLILGKALANFLLDFFMRLIHITDPHLSSLASFNFLTVKGKRKSGYLSWRRQRRYIHRPEILARLTQAVHDESPDQILLTGDLIHIGLEDEMIEAARWLKTLGTPEQILLIPGNHDNYAADSLAAMNRHWGEYLPAQEAGINDYAGAYPVVRTLDGIQLFAVNTSCVTRIFSAQGELGKAQLSRLRNAMAGSVPHPPGGTADPSVFTCLLIHHPPLPGMAKHRKALRDAGKLQAIIDEQQPDLVLYGHIHCNRDTKHGEVRAFCTASASSALNASYRVFDVEKSDKGWHCHMRLMSLDNNNEAEAGFKTAAELSWSST